jgi:CubicO group peptidase (beta-lactamase class C family)
MSSLENAVDAEAERTIFSGVVSWDRSGTIEFAKAYGLADRAHAIPNALETRFAIASGTKGFTALAVVSLIEDGTLTLETTARSVLGDDLPLIDDAVTVEHLLSHRSGIGDYLNEDEVDDITEYFPPVPVHELDTTERYVKALDGFPTVSAPGEVFTYNNGGYVVVALIAERVSGVPFHDLVRRRVCEPAGLTATEFLRSDELPGDAAIGYLADVEPRTNVFHVPVRGNGDGGIYSTAGDITILWRALFAGRIVPAAWVEEMLRPRSVDPRDSRRYGLGFWLHASGQVEIHGYDAGVSFRSVHNPAAATTQTVISNTTEGSWPLEELLDAHPSVRS